MTLTTFITDKGQFAGRTFKGKYRKAGGRTRSILLKDLLDLVQLGLDSSLFTFLGEVYLQSLGACIGMQASPILCGIVASFEEYLWAQSFDMLQTAKHLSGHYSDLFLFRYVDNRITLVNKQLRTIPAILQLRDLDFYTKPIQLEIVPDSHVLGYQLQVNPPAMTYMLPSEAWQIRSPRSATPMMHMVSAFSSRVHIIKRGTFPPSARFQMYRQLVALHIRHQYQPGPLWKVINKIEQKPVSPGE